MCELLVDYTSGTFLFYSWMSLIQLVRYLTEKLEFVKSLFSLSLDGCSLGFTERRFLCSIIRMLSFLSKTRQLSSSTTKSEVDLDVSGKSAYVYTGGGSSVQIPGDTTRLRVDKSVKRKCSL